MKDFITKNSWQESVLQKKVPIPKKVPLHITMIDKKNISMELTCPGCSLHLSYVSTTQSFMNGVSNFPNALLTTAKAGNVLYECPRCLEGMYLTAVKCQK
jgi:hypothetical protein